MSELIAGRPGLEVWRATDGILKIGGWEMERNNIAGLQNEARMLRLMEGTGFAPRLLGEPRLLDGEWRHDGRFATLQEDVGPTLKNGAIVKDPVRFRRNCIYLLQALRSRGIRHGDLTTTNLALREGDVAVALDWQESRLFDEPGEDKQPHSDSYLLWQRLAEAGLDEGRIMRRWMAVLADLGGDVGTEKLKGKRLLDLGCFQGDFCGLAAAEGMEATGFDADAVSIAVARGLWGKVASFECADVTNVSYGADAVLLFSTWPYVLRNHGPAIAERLLREILAQADRLYFETQLAGDGPGPDFLATDEDVGNYLARFGTARSLVSIPVAGRAASRTVWMVTR